MSTPGPYGAYPQPGGYPPGGYPPAPRGYLEGGPVGFGDAVKEAFSHGFVYRGRASRSAYWWFVLFQAIVWIALDVLFIIPAGMHNTPAIFAVLFIVLGLVGIYLFLVGLALLVRRLHDIDRTGWWVLIGLVPFGGIVLLIFSLLEGTPGPNRYQP
jgi:uncharacterized membrane protein YhaH (DUF805 family)